MYFRNIYRCKESTEKEGYYTYGHAIPASELPYEFNGKANIDMKQPLNENFIPTDDGSLSRSYYQGVMKDPFYSTGYNEPIYEKPVGQNEL